MTHIAMQEVNGEGSQVAWGEHVTDEEYAATGGRLAGDVGNILFKLPPGYLRAARKEIQFPIL